MLAASSSGKHAPAASFAASCHFIGSGGTGSASPSFGVRIFAIW